MPLFPIQGSLQMSAEKNTIYVGGFSMENVTEDVLYELFSSFGEVRSVQLHLDGATKFAYIRFQNAQEAAYAIDNMNLNEFHGDILRCNYATNT
jgi:peptidyl-prolyl isomerase E (cyclophilin E)